MAQLAYTVFKRVRGFMNALDAFKPSLELRLMFANLSIHR